ncbi:hypothetical protein RND71_011752 [Anisodus tanguticus]|uniref:Uncharacterized protein n=1 Tax=Anisodus tanguticus TaxID=243964 RepID=A0AAE1VQ41_9SOLA|nr:hypothetical protein RND71_011752 [Anisodus tanguticus]
MASPLEAVRHRRTGAVLFYKKPHPPFKTDPLIGLPKNNSVHELPISSSNNVTETKQHRKGAADEHVMFDFGNDYGFWQNLCDLEKTIPSSSQYKVHSKYFSEVARSNTSPAMIEDAKYLSEDVYQLSSQEDMLNEFMKLNLFYS